MTRSVVWVKPEGAEIAHVTLEAGRLTASGAAIGGDPLPYRLEYELTTGERYVTSRLLVTAYGRGWRRRLELINRPEGEWSIHADAEGDTEGDTAAEAGGGVALPPPGGDAAELRGALDCDLGLSPLTNTMPALRLEGDDPMEILVAWVSVPDLAVTPSRQTYQVVRRDGDRMVVRFADPEFTEEIVFGGGLVLDYPSIARMVLPEAD
jgi:hypothetical protein